MSTGISISSINRIKELAEEKKYAEALEILDTQNLDKSINPQFLRISGEIFRENKRYYDSRKILIRSHQMSPQGIRIIYELIQLYLELGYFTRARQYYEQYLFYSTSEDIQKDYVEYAMKKASRAEVKELASILIPILERLPEDKWNFEAVLLYDKMGRRDKALEECQYILENFKESVFVDLIIRYIDDKLDVDEYFYIYPKEEIPEDEELFGDLIAKEDKILQEDYLRMYPPEARIVVEAEDKEGIETKPAKEKKSKKTKKGKSKDKHAGKHVEEERNTDARLAVGLKDQTAEHELADHLMDEKPIQKQPETGIEESISKTAQEKEVEDEQIRQEREVALEKLLAKKIDTEQIKKSAQQVAKAVKEIDAEKTKHQVKAVAESVKDNVKKATDVLGEAVGAKIRSDDQADAVMAEDGAIVDGIIESVLEPPKKVVGQVITNEELDAIIPDSLEAMSAEEIADLEAKRIEAERLELEALEASFRLEEEKKRSKKKIADDIPEETTDNPEESIWTGVLQDTSSADHLPEMLQETQTSALETVSEGDFSRLKEELLREIEGEQEEPLESLGFITVVQSDVDKSIETDIPDTAKMLHQMIQNKEFYTGDDSTKFESKASYNNHDFEVEDYEFETYRDIEEAVIDDMAGEYKTDSDELLSVEMIYAQEDVLDFDEIIPVEKTFTMQKNAAISNENTVQEEITVPKETVVPEEITLPEETTVPEEVIVPEETIVPEGITVPKETVVPEEITVPEETIVPEGVIVPEETIVSEEITVPKEVIIQKEAAASRDTIAAEETNSLWKVAEEINSNVADIGSMMVNTREKLRIRILISDSMVRKLSDLKESR